MKTFRIVIILALFIASSSCVRTAEYSAKEESAFTQAASNGKIVNEGFNRCLSYTSGWLRLADSATGLIPRNINDSASRDIWNAKDCAADN